MKNSSYVGIAKIWLSDDLLKTEDAVFLKALLVIRGNKIENKQNMWKIELKGLETFKTFSKDFTSILEMIKRNSNVSEKDYDCIMFYNNGFDYKYATFQKFYATAEIIIKEK